MTNEINFREKHLSDKEEDLSAVLAEITLFKNQKSAELIKNEKTKEIRKCIEEYIYDKIPELSNYEGTFRNLKNVKCNILKTDMDFTNLIFDYIVLIFTTYDKSDIFKKDKPDDSEKQKFKISLKTTFKTLKKTACIFWDVDEKEYQITDGVESIIYDESLEIEKYLRQYSVQINEFRLVHINVLKSRNKLIQTQEHRIKECNTIGDGIKKNRVHNLFKLG